MADNRRPAPVARPAPVVRPGEESPRQAARRLTAEAKNAEAQARNTAAQAELEKARAATKAAERIAEKQAAGRSTGERIYQGGINLAGIAAGIAGGYKIAGGIEKRHSAALRASARQVKALGATADKLLKSKMPRALMMAKLKGVVSTADKLKLTRVKGPLGLAPAVFLIAEGAVSRFGLTKTVENEAARELIGAVGMGSMLAGGTVLYKRAMYNATLSKLPEANAFANIQAARAKLGVTVPGQVAAKAHAPIAQAGGKAARVAAAAAKAGSPAATALSFAGKAAGIAGKVALPLQIALTAVETYRGYQKEGVKGALVGAGDSLTFGAVSALRKLMAGSGSGAGDGGARLDLAKRASGRLNFENRSALLRSAAKGPKRPTGWTQAYYRSQAGRTVRVTGYKTPTRSFR